MAIAPWAYKRGGDGATAATKTTQIDGSRSEVRLGGGVAPSLGARPGQSRAKPASVRTSAGLEQEGQVAAVDEKSAVAALAIKSIELGQSLPVQIDKIVPCVV